MLQTELSRRLSIRHPILPTAEVIRHMVEEAKDEIERLSSVRV